MDAIRFSLLAVLVLGLCGVFAEEAKGDELWNYTTESTVQSVAISADGNYIAAGNYGYLYLFNNNSNFITYCSSW